MLTTAGASGFMSGIGLIITSIFVVGHTGTAAAIATYSTLNMYLITCILNSFTTKRPDKAHSMVVELILFVPPSGIHLSYDITNLFTFHFRKRFVNTGGVVSYMKRIYCYSVAQNFLGWLFWYLLFVNLHNL